MRGYLQVWLVASAVMIASCLPLRAQYVMDHNLIGFIAGNTLIGRTAKDNERWSVAYTRNGDFKITFTNGSVGRGHWQVKGAKLEMIFQRRFQDICRSIFIADDGKQEWRDCKTGQVSSYILNPIYDRRGPDLNAHKAKEIEQGMAFIKGMAGGMPIANQPIVQAMLAGSEAFLTKEARRLLSPEGRRLHGNSALETFNTGRPSTWANPLANESGGYRVVDSFKNSKGHECKRVISTVTVKGEAKEEEQVQCKDQNGQPYSVG